jgi:predicted nucleotide-binding protein (sugar kinase/HSP70/actin superfamily)
MINLQDVPEVDKLTVDCVFTITNSINEAKGYKRKISTLQVETTLQALKWFRDNMNEIIKEAKDGIPKSKASQV